MRLGIDFGGTNLKVGVFDQHGKVHAFHELKVSSINRNNFAENLVREVADLVKPFKFEKGGFSSKGMIDTQAGMVLNDIGAGSLLVGVPIGQLFSEELGIPFTVDNDARAYALGEDQFGAGKPYNVTACMTLGTGVGCTLIKDGKPFIGSDPLTGLLGGHLTIDRNGPVCSCGSRGCLELYCSATALHKRIKLEMPIAGRLDPLPEFFRLGSVGSEPYAGLLKEFQSNLSLGIVNVIHAFGPEVVVLGGGVMKSAEMILPAVIEQVSAMAWTYPRKKVKILPSLLGNKAAAMGMAFHPVLK